MKLLGPAALIETFQVFTGQPKEAAISKRSLATCNTKGHPEMGSEENGRKSVQ